MKKYVSCLVSIMFIFHTAVGQAEVGRVALALKTGDVSSVAKYFEKVVDVTILNEQSTYSKSQAERVLKSFFSKNNVKNFSVLHTGSSNGDNVVFVIGELDTEQGPYRTYIMFKQRRDKSYFLQEMRVEQ